MDDENHITMEKEVKRKETYQRKKDRWLKKREEYKERAEKFSELKGKRLKDKEIKEETSEAVEDHDIWMELENLIKDNQMALKRLENYKVTVEI